MGVQLVQDVVEEGDVVVVHDVQAPVDTVGL